MSVSSEHLMVTGGNFCRTASGSIQLIQQSTNIQDSKGFELLSKNVATTALHNSGQLSDPPKCHPGTRVAILDALVAWGAAEKRPFPIKWIHGPAGAGKTAIMRRLAELLASKGLLLAAFFFFRTDPLRNGPYNLISTLAFQICLAIPQTRPHIDRAIDTNPLIFSLSISQQIQTLIITPFNLVSSDPSFDINAYPRVILIDGLDECQDREKQQEVLQVFSENVELFSLPIAVLVASRPEHHIRATFDLGRLNKSSSRVALDDSFHPDSDIRKFYLDKFLDVRTSHPLRAFLPSVWPSSDTLDLLVRKASGQFIYASTVIKFVSSIRHDPSIRLDILLGVLDRGNLKPFEQLDLLYATIFHNVDPLDLVATLRLLGIILTPPSVNSHSFPRSPIFLEQLLGMNKGEPQRLLLDLESLLTIVDDSEDVYVFHSSLSDFLFDKSRSGEFFLDKGEVYADLATHCIRHIASASEYHTLEYSIANLPSYLSQASWTQSLHDTIMQCEVEQMCRLCSWRGSADGFRRLVPVFIKAMRSLNSLDAQLLYTLHRQNFMEARLLWLALAVSTEQLDSGYLQSFFDCIGRPLSSDVIKVGSQGDLPNTWEELNDKGRSFVGDAHASFAVYLLGCMSVTSSMHRCPNLEVLYQPDDRSHKDSATFCICVQRLLPGIIDRSSVRTDLTELIQQPLTYFNGDYLTAEIKSSFTRYKKRLKEQQTRQKEDSMVQLEVTNNSDDFHHERSHIRQAVLPTRSELLRLAVLCGVVCAWLGFCIAQYLATH